jgi:hypothetical protein
MDIVDYSELQGKVFQTSKGVWRSSLLNDPGSYDHSADSLCFVLGFTFGEEQEPTRTCNVWSSHAALRTDPARELERVLKAVNAWLEGSARTGKLPFPPA